MPDEKNIIAADKLCALSGLTDRRHRQLAAEGYFPPPIDGKYQMAQTIAGILRYYREMYQRTSRTLAEDKQVKMKREIELLDLKIAEQNKKLVPVEQVENVWTGITTAIRQTILASEIPEQLKDELCSHLRKINPNDYCRKSDSEGGDQGAPSDSTAADADSVAMG